MSESREDDMGAVNGSVKLGRTEMDYISFGRGEKPLVLIPGLGDGLTTVAGKAAMAGALYRAYTADYRVTAFSRPRELEAGVTTRDMADQLAEGMDQLGLKCAHVVGISQGGMIAQHLAARRPELVDRLVLVVTVPRSTELMRNNAEQMMELARRGAYRELMELMILRAHPEQFQKRYLRALPLLRLTRGPESFERFLLQAQACITHDATAVLGAIRARTMVIGGELDETLGVEGSLELARAIPDTRLCICPGQGHGLYMDMKDFSRRLLDFLGEP